MSVTSSRPWSRLRARVIREATVCAIGGELLNKEAKSPAPDSVEVDHIISRFERPDLELVRSNLAAVCRKHNRAKGSGTEYTAEPAPSRAW